MVTSCIKPCHALYQTLSNLVQDPGTPCTRPWSTLYQTLEHLVPDPGTPCTRPCQYTASRGPAPWEFILTLQKVCKIKQIKKLGHSHTIQFIFPLHHPTLFHSCCTILQLFKVASKNALVLYASLIVKNYNKSLACKRFLQALYFCNLRQKNICPNYVASSVTFLYKSQTSKVTTTRGYFCWNILYPVLFFAASSI